VSPHHDLCPDLLALSIAVNEASC